MAGKTKQTKRTRKKAPSAKVKVRSYTRKKPASLPPRGKGGKFSKTRKAPAKTTGGGARKASPVKKAAKVVQQTLF